MEKMLHMFRQLHSFTKKLILYGSILIAGLFVISAILYFSSAVLFQAELAVEYAAEFIHIAFSTLTALAVAACLCEFITRHDLK